MMSGQQDERLLVHAYLDGELTTTDALAIERRMRDDPVLAAERHRVEALRDVLRTHLPPPQVSDALVRRVRARQGRRKGASIPWQAMAASLLLGAVGASGATWALLEGSAREDPTDSVLSSHIRSLMASQPTDVTSSDRHTVKPWFNGRIPQAPRVVDLSAAGFPLAGARIDVVKRVPAPTLVYCRRQHVISVTAVPAAEGDASSSPATVDGYNVVSWRDGDVAYWAVSDLNMAELKEFVAAFRKVS